MNNVVLSIQVYTLSISAGLRGSGGRSSGLSPSVAMMGRLSLTLMVFVDPGWISSPPSSQLMS